METITNKEHPNEELLQRYATGKLAPNAIAAISAHLFECDSCFQRHENEVDLLLALRKESEQTEEARVRVSFWSQIFSGRNSLLAAAAMAVILMVFFIPRAGNNASEAVVANLIATRSGNATTEVPAARPIRLRLDPISAAPAEHVRAELVTSSGTQVWQGQADLREGKWETLVTATPRAGSY